MSNIITIRPDLLSPVRSGLRAAVGEAADALVEATEQPAERNVRAGGCTGYRARLDRLCALLDAIGWADRPPLRAAEIDLDTHRAALSEGLQIALFVAEDTARDERLVLAGELERPAPGRFERSPSERVEALRELIWALDIQTEAASGTDARPSGPREAA